MHFVDHLFIFILFVVQPIHGAYAYRKYVQKIKAGEPANRIRSYRDILLLEWAAFAVVAAAWYWLGRPADALGFVASSMTQIAGGVAVLAVAIVFLLFSWRSAKAASDEKCAKDIEALGDLVYVMPANKRDFRYFFHVSITAGIVEEFLYRGFAFWYLSHFLPIWAVIVVSSVAFGLGHTYQGLSGVIRVTAIGIVFGVYYYLTGSIWLPMLAHAVLDILQGATLLEMMRRTDVQTGEQHPAHS